MEHDWRKYENLGGIEICRKCARLKSKNPPPECDNIIGMIEQYCAEKKDSVE